MFHTSGNSKTTLTSSALVIVAVASLFAAGSILGNQKAFAANLAGSGFAGTNPGISYPSPLSHYFGGDVLHHHHHGGFHYHGGYNHHHGSFHYHHHGGHHHR